MEKEWLDTLSAVNPQHVTYTDYVECGRLRKYFHLVLKSLIQIAFLLYCAVLVARNLKEIQGCKIVIALTHMRTPNDIRLAKEVEEIDLILGGHDHISEFIQVKL